MIRATFASPTAALIWACALRLAWAWQFILIGRQLHERHRGERGLAAVVAPEVVLQARRHVAKAALMLFDCGAICGAVAARLRPHVVPRLDDHLQVHLVAQADFEIDWRNCPGVQSSSHTAFMFVIVCIARQIHLELKMPRIDRVGTLRLVRPFSPIEGSRESGKVLAGQ